ncbi:protoheme IX farnesyltransferase [Draconibacterium sp. IB214405]|uniref:protoheme IX farnesyltransferase n=1 Tax=Draconibacterium sp. IB214405 TaxID=3097352 RepID=UPI002A11F45D|nr:protoheme IX farnesyltransferase [Draconibacterium sp. IB214405]MDX8338387.1 protoheme IX farnesyltransferase [Draconibacterium sp. IB214405]
MKQQLKIIYELGKVRISLPIALSALTGYVLYTKNVDAQGWWLLLGVFLMACSSSVINHWQERDVDAQMPRTKDRPLPSGRISPQNALLVAIGFAVLGSIILLLSNPPMALFLSWLTLFFYNGIYTPLKKVSAFAVIPGSMVGAIPPMIGWAGAGGSLSSEIILLVAAFFFIGQIPHFWLLLLMFGEQYKLAKMPSLNQLFSDLQIKRVTYTWILTTVASAFLVIFFVIGNKLIMFLLMFYIFYLLSSLTMAVFVQDEFKVRPSFYKLNFLYLFMMIFLIVDSLVHT